MPRETSDHVGAQSSNQLPLQWQEGWREAGGPGSHLTLVPAWGHFEGWQFYNNSLEFLLSSQCQWWTGRKIVVQDCWRSLWGWICTSVLTARIWCFLRVNPKVKMKIFLGFVFSLSFFTVFKCHSEPLEVAEGGGTFCSWCHGVIPAGIPHWCSDLVLF